MQVVVDRLLTEYSRSGAGPVVLLLHGWGDTMQTFNELQIDLEKKYTVIALDLPGFGKTSSPTETFTLASYAHFVHMFLDKIEATKIYAVVGHSNGGAIAIKAVSTAELQPDKLVLLASSGIRSTYKGRKKALRLAAKAAKIPTSLMPKNIQNSLKKRAYSIVGSDIFVVEHLQPTFREVVGEDLLSAARSINTDTLILYGSEDAATLPAYGKMFANAIKNSQLHVIEGANHFLHQGDYSKEISNYVEEFLA